MADTTTASLTQELFDLISAEMLVTVDDEYMFYNNGPIQHADPAAQTPGAKTINFNRLTLPTGAYSELSRRLTDGTPVSTTGVAIAMSQVQLTIREYAGPHDGVSIKPFSVTEFLKNRALHNIAEMVGSLLRRDRNRMLDTTVMNLLLAAAQVVTPNSEAVAALAAGVSMSVQGLRLLNKAMKDAKVPTFANGRYRMMLNTTDELNLKKDPDFREANRYLGNANPAFAGMVGSFEGFDFGVSTMIPTTTAGAGDALTAYQSVAYGPWGIGHGLGMAPNVRRADDTDFGRSEKLIWKSEEAIGTLYSDLLFRTVTTG